MNGPISKLACCSDTDPQTSQNKLFMSDRRKLPTFMQRMSISLKAVPRKDNGLGN